MRDFWDLNNDGQLDIGEKSMRDAHIMSVLDEMEAEQSGSHGYGGYTTSSGSGMNALGVILLVVGVILLFGACAA